MAEIFLANETGTGEVALITEDAVQLQRMTDRLVDLQDHLVRHQQKVTRTVQGVGRQQQLQCQIGRASCRERV